MSAHWERLLDRWSSAGLLDAATAGRIREWESTQESSRTRWPVVLAVAFGCAMLGAGVLLFVAAHWEELSPAKRFSLVLAMTAPFHGLAAAVSDKFPKLTTGLHGVGTITLGAGIFLAGQIFNLEEHWPGGVMLWALGALLAYLVLRDWVQGSLLAILAPYWLAAEWSVRVTDRYHDGDSQIAFALLLTSVAYLSGSFDAGSERDHLRRALRWIGGLAFFPSAIALTVTSSSQSWQWWRVRHIPFEIAVLGWMAGALLPLLVAVRLRGRRSGWYLLSILWASGLTALCSYVEIEKNVVAYLWCLLGCLGFIYWGLHESRKERINMGVAGFGITLIGFFFSDIMDKLGRSTSLIVLGVLFLAGGWYLEKTRRRLIARIEGAAQ